MSLRSFVASIKDHSLKPHKQDHNTYKSYNGGIGYSSPNHRSYTNLIRPQLVTKCQMHTNQKTALFRSSSIYKAGNTIDLSKKRFYHVLVKKIDDKYIVKGSEPNAPRFSIPNASQPQTNCISLTEYEKQLFKFLVDVVDASGSKTTLRVAGGWVRDKFLGRSSQDIDISTDNISGELFTQNIHKYLDQCWGNLSESGFPEDFVQFAQKFDKSNLSSVAVTKLNPEQSKHLETAIMRLYGKELNFVQLRTESYLPSSRIPQISSGDALQDAQRRDFTINTLFYNIMTDTIEDFTGCAYKDLLSRRIATPLPPLETLKDDPLRALRAIRFASRFDFNIDDNLIEGISDNTVRELLRHKVAPPRIGVEVQKMFMPVLESEHVGNQTIKYDNNPLKSLQNLIRTNMHTLVFDPELWELTTQPNKWNDEVTLTSYTLASALLKIYNKVEFEQNNNKNGSKMSSKEYSRAPSRVDGKEIIPDGFESEAANTTERSVLMTLTFLFPFFHRDYAGIEKRDKEGKIMWLTIFKRNLQFPLSMLISSAKSLNSSVRMLEIIDELLSDSPVDIRDQSMRLERYSKLFIDAMDNPLRKQKLGWWMRDSPPYWKTMILLSKFLRPNLTSKWKSDLVLDIDILNKSYTDADFEDVWRSFFKVELALIEALESSGLVNARQIQPLINGRDLMFLLDISQGALVGEAINELLKWQFCHLEGTVEEAKQFMLDLKKIKGW